MFLSGLAKVPRSQMSIALVSAIALGLRSCTSRPVATNEPEAAEATEVEDNIELQILTTFLPITQFTKVVAGDRAEGIQLLPTHVGPDYQAKPADAQAIANERIASLVG